MRVLSNIRDQSFQLANGHAVQEVIMSKTVYHAARLDQSHYLHFVKSNFFDGKQLLMALNHLPHSEHIQLSDDCVDAIGEDRLRFRTQTCGFSQTVQCSNKTCAYAHSPAELRPIPEGAKRTPAKQTRQHEVTRRCTVYARSDEDDYYSPRGRIFHDEDGFARWKYDY